MPKHSEQRIMMFTKMQMFQLVSDVERYPEFLPWCLATRITKNESTFLEADMVVGFRMFRENFGSRVEFDRSNFVIDVKYTHGPFKYLMNRWEFLDHKEECKVDFVVDFEFRSRLLEKVIGTLFTDAVTRMVQAFENRARQLYTSPKIENRKVSSSI